VKYILYIANNCHECEEVESEVSKMSVEVEIINVDEDDQSPPIPTFAYPALFKGEILLAYGSDILKRLKAKV
tara:strand:+ start:1882 stop:2097 length:216 start_codon:yes stop_codon:yes gene_type:complete